MRLFQQVMKRSRVIEVEPGGIHGVKGNSVEHRLPESYELRHFFSMTTASTPPAVVASSIFTPKKGQRAALLALLSELANAMIYSEAGCTHYSVHRALAEDEDGPLLVIQAYVSLAAFREHGARIKAEIPRIAALLEGAPSPPVLFEQVSLGGPPAKESFSK